MPQCEGHKKDGNSCGRVVPAGQHFCFQHGGPCSSKTPATPVAAVIVFSPVVHLFALHGDQLQFLTHLVQVALKKVRLHPARLELVTLPLSITKEEVPHCFPAPITWETVLLNHNSFWVQTKKAVAWDAELPEEILGAGTEHAGGITLKEIVECVYRCKMEKPTLTVSEDDGKKLSMMAM